MARPKKQIDEEQVKQLAGINCSYAEMAAVLGCDPSQIATLAFWGSDTKSY